MKGIPLEEPESRNGEASAFDQVMGANVLYFSSRQLSVGILLGRDICNSNSLRMYCACKSCIHTAEKESDPLFIHCGA